MINEVFVTFETAKLLNIKGFSSADCHTAYDEDGEFFWYGDYSKDRHGVIDAPTLQMAMKWLREVHKVHIAILWYCGAYTGKNSFCYHIDRIDNYEDKGYNKIGFDSYEEAAETAIKYYLTNLI